MSYFKDPTAERLAHLLEIQQFMVKNKEQISKLDRLAAVIYRVIKKLEAKGSK